MPDLGLAFLVANLIAVPNHYDLLLRGGMHSAVLANAYQKEAAAANRVDVLGT